MCKITKPFNSYGVLDSLETRVDDVFTLSGTEWSYTILSCRGFVLSRSLASQRLRASHSLLLVANEGVTAYNTKPKLTSKPQLTSKPTLTSKPEISSKPKLTSKSKLTINSNGGRLVISRARSFISS